MDPRTVLTRELQARLGITRAIASHAGEALDRDWEEQAQQLGGVGVRDSLDERTRGEVEAIRAALQRVDDGSYGTCVVCGESIEPKRLEAVPWTSMCLSCAEDAAG